MPRPRGELLDLLATISGELNPVLRQAMINALDQRAAALHFSDPRSFRVSDLLKFASAAAAFSALGSDAIVVVAVAGSCFVLLQIAWVASYAVTQIGTALVDRVAEKLRRGGAPRG